MIRSTATATAALLAVGMGLANAQAQPPTGPGAYSQPGYQNYMPPQPIRQYPQLNAPLYPSPRQDIPVQVGGTLITNQAFAPHEMLHPHEYRGIYGPYYYKVKGNWLWTPFGIESHDKWELMGTEVKVKYRSSYSPLAGFMPPFHP